MSDNLRESLSALMDGEATELEVRRLLRSNDPSVRESWAHYHHVRETMLDGGVPFADLDVSRRVADAIANEQRSAGWRDLVRPLSGVAVAAGVAAVVVFGVRGLEGQFAGSETTSPVSRVYPALPGNVAVDSSGGYATSSGARSVDDDKAEVVLRRFEHYMERHTERAALNSVPGMVSYARVTSHEVE